MMILITVIGIVLHFFQPARLILISANIANFGALIFPFAFMYLNRRLPPPARPSGWAYVALGANAAFFGFFFVNFALKELTGSALVRF
jgi:hypothetical protein